MHNPCGQAIGEIRSPGSISTSGSQMRITQRGRSDPKAHTLHPTWAWWRGKGVPLSTKQGVGWPSNHGVVAGCATLGKSLTSLCGALWKFSVQCSHRAQGDPRHFLRDKEYPRPEPPEPLILHSPPNPQAPVMYNFDLEVNF